MFGIGFWHVAKNEDLGDDGVLEKEGDLERIE